jgi:hypothetical protein
MIKKLHLIIILCLVISLVGCTKLISTEYKNVEVNVVDIHHSAMWLQPIKAGKATTFITHPAEYDVTVEYNGVSYTIDDEDTYNRYKDKVGQTTIGTLEIRTYDNNTVKHNIIELK